VPREFTAGKGEICLEVPLAGNKYVRELDSWAQADGRLFEFPYHASQQNLQLTTTFHLNQDVAILLETAKPKNFAEMGDKIAQWQEPESKQQPSYQYHNFIGSRPERLWLIIPFLHPTRVDVAINGEPVANVKVDGPSSSAFVDVTDIVIIGAENRIKLSIPEMSSNGFMGPYLLYPEEAATGTVLPTPGKAGRQVVYTRSLVPAPPPRYRQGAGPIVTEAQMMAHVTLQAAASLRVKINLPPEKIDRVMYFESGFGWMGQHQLGYDKDSLCWTGLVQPGPRASIQENETIYVWAAGTDGVRSEYYPVKVSWDFTTQPNQ
jgi:hypothetical protein